MGPTRVQFGHNALILPIWDPFAHACWVEGLYYPSSENKGADQLRGNREADLRLCFRICKKAVFSQRGSYEPRCEKTGIRGFLPGITQTRLYSRRRWLDA